MKTVTPLVLGVVAIAGTFLLAGASRPTSTPANPNKFTVQAQVVGYKDSTVCGHPFKYRSIDYQLLYDQVPVFSSTVRQFQKSRQPIQIRVPQIASITPHSTPKRYVVELVAESDVVDDSKHTIVPVSAYHTVIAP